MFSAIQDKKGLLHLLLTHEEQIRSYGVRHLGFFGSFATSKSKEEIFTDPVLSRAILRSLEIFGEAAKKLDRTFKALHPDVDWEKMAGTGEII